ncbi:hypothetical protein [Pleurocapsa sp. FMAR1]|uniref:hypothetical protein n=1 Tax=Pleurocapsa sp. FMAR1 TaxID=3040204 RepID=UPI0029C69407|nr:hypothetical protein [Pleurocapsa sp. FMAR1]
MLQNLAQSDGTLGLKPEKKKRKVVMRNLAAYILPSILGLVAGIGHGITSHNQNLPFSLSDQLIESVTGQQSTIF